MSYAHRATRHPFATDVGLRGRVARFNAERHFGLIAPDRSGARDDDLIFVHYSDVIPPGDLRAGQRVTYELEPRANGSMQAVRVRVLGAADTGTDDV